MNSCDPQRRHLGVIAPPVTGILHVLHDGVFATFGQILINGQQMRSLSSSA